MTGAGTRETLLRDLERLLHDLCQPVTTLQSRLEYGQMCGDLLELREAVEGGLVETERIFACVREMRERLLRG